MSIRFQYQVTEMKCNERIEHINNFLCYCQKLFNEAKAPTSYDRHEGAQQVGEVSM